MNTISAASPTSPKTLFAVLAIVEVIAVRAALWFLLGSPFLTPVRDWQTRHLYNDFTTHAALLLVPVLLLLVLRRPLAEYGITFTNLRQDLTAALTVFLFFAIAGGLLGVLPFKLWYGALGAAVLYLLVLWMAARQLDGKPNPKSGLLTIGLAVFIFSGYGLSQGVFPGIGPAVSNLVFYGIFVGFGEECFYRGYAQSRLNAALGRPYTFLGAQVGWGWILASLIFGLSHLGGGPWYVLWTTASGLAFGYIYERTRSIVAPAILHGLPQALFQTFISWSF
jgi:membrane protease YdiL (CAAX protease family)